MKKLALLSIALLAVTACGRNVKQPAPLANPYKDKPVLQNNVVQQTLSIWLSQVSQPDHGVWHATLSRVRDDRIGGTNKYFYYVAEYLGQFSNTPNNHFDFTFSYFYANKSNFTIDGGYDPENFVENPTIGNGIQLYLNWMTNFEGMKYTTFYNVDGEIGMYYYKPGETQVVITGTINKEGFVTYYEDMTVDKINKKHHIVSVSYACYVL